MLKNRKGNEIGKRILKFAPQRYSTHEWLRTPAVHSISEKKVNTIDIERILQLFVLRNVSLRAKGECGLVVEVDKVTNRKDVIKIVRHFKLLQQVLLGWLPTVYII